MTVLETGLFNMAWLMIAVPLVVAALLLVLGRRSDAWGHLLATVAPIVSFVIGLVLFIDLLGRDVASRAVEVGVYRFIVVGSWDLRVGLLIDQLSILFVLLITFVGSLIHIYAIGYMAHDTDRRRFFAYLNLFIAAMLTLVLADNYLILFVGWEGVGLASYLLIGFWFGRPAAARAGNKAFIMNRIGDLGLTMAIFTMLAQFGSVRFTDVSAKASGLTSTWATLLGFMLLLAACGKSAQVPLQAWLLDAMEGPTPVSALIHAATMVTAGVYLVVRSHEIYAQTGAASLAVAIVGTVTLALGSGAQFLLRSAACTICDYIVEQENRFSLPSPTRDTSTTKRVLPSGADSYLIISSTLLLPCLLVGLCVRNEIYAKTVSTNPGIFFVVVAAVNALALIALSWMPSATSTRV